MLVVGDPVYGTPLTRFWYTIALSESSGAADVDGVLHDPAKVIDSVVVGAPLPGTKVNELELDDWT